MSGKAPSNPSVKEALIDRDQEGQRIDNFLRTNLKGVPKTHIYRILRTGQVRVNGGRIRPEYRLKAGDRVRIPPVRVAEAGQTPAPSPALLERLRGRVIHEDSSLLILNKPAGLAVHGGSGLDFGAIEALRALRTDEPFLELAHRLDRDTSGCLIIAKKRSALRGIQTLLREGHGVDKRYLALVVGRWPRRRSRVEAPLRKNTLRGGERVVRVEPSGKPSETRFEVVETFSGATLVAARPITGRTHQIRVHAVHVGHPIAGDDKYGDAAFNRSMADVGLRRLFLHAESLRFRLPGAEQEIQVSAPLDDELEAVLGRLR
ncbi:MAG: 23S rRNA pseudouridine(955/2504/2580) synthase RluC [Chromatiales bacterium]|nr:23S rRNA pseudouridine(955/2504/2580) synthase RluC [Chromatiales bacterium]